MGLTEALMAAMMTQAAHTQGHMGTANRMFMQPFYHEGRYRLPHVDWGKGVEVVPPWVSNPRGEQQKRAAAQWHGSGFEGQQDVGRKLEGTNIGDEYSLLQGLYKLGYIAGVKPSDTSGDVENIERISGNKMTTPLLGLSALADLYKWQNPDSKWGLDFTTFNQGAPGLVFRKKF